MKEPIRIAIYMNNRNIKGIFTELPEHETPIEITLHDYDPDTLTDEEKEALEYSSYKWYPGETHCATYAREVIESICTAVDD